jgi:hypothetical protein
MPVKSFIATIRLLGAVSSARIFPFTPEAIVTDLIEFTPLVKPFCENPLGSLALNPGKGAEVGIKDGLNCDGKADGIFAIIF